MMTTPFAKTPPNFAHDMPDVTKILSDLVALPSVNPMGGFDDGPEFYEYRVSEYLEAFFLSLGVTYQRQTVAPKRDNVVARLDGTTPPDQGGGVLMFEAHQDTVPVTGMTIPPWTPTVRDGRLYGRGACDIKGGMAAMLSAFARLADERPADMPTLIMACTVNEEHGYTGASALVELWDKEDSIFPRQPDGAIVAEPTGLQAVVAHKGVVRWRCHARGRAGHSSQPHLAVSAIFKMHPVLKALERYQTEIAPSLGRHPRCGTPTLSVGTITGGLSVNTVPDLCTIQIDRRLIPGEDPHEAYRHVVDFIAWETEKDAAIEHEEPFLIGYGLRDEQNTALASALVAAAGEAGIDCETIGVAYGTDAAAFAAAGVPSVVFGPGSIDQAHTADEWVPLDELRLASEALYHLGRRGIQ